MATSTVCVTTNVVDCSSFTQRKLECRHCHITRVPDDVLENVLLKEFEAVDLGRLAVVSTRFRDLSKCDSRWKELFIAAWGPVNPLLERASKLAGSWRALYISKTATYKASDPYRKPCPFEISASLENLTEHKARQPEKDSGVVFLVDGSGSMQEEDFSTMTSFITSATEAICQTAPDCKVGVVQFSNDVRIELTPQPYDPELFRSVLHDMARMNGGTNIATSIQKAGQLLKKHVNEDGIRVVVLLTDGRVDSYQAREAAQMAERLADEQMNVTMFAFGVGRGVDRMELVRIIGAGNKTGAEDRYMELCVRDEPYW